AARHHGFAQVRRASAVERRPGNGEGVTGVGIRGRLDRRDRGPSPRLRRCCRRRAPPVRRKTLSRALRATVLARRALVTGVAVALLLSLHTLDSPATIRSSGGVVGGPLQTAFFDVHSFDGRRGGLALTRARLSGTSVIRL